MVKRYGDIKKDEQGFVWRVDLLKSTKYPNGRNDKVVFVSPWESYDFVRYDQAGNFIAGNSALAD